MGPAQRRQVAADAQGIAQVPGQRTDVGARGALHRHLHVHHGPALFRLDAMDVEAVDGHGPGRELDVLAGADAGVGAFAVDLDGADAAGHLLDLARQGGHPGADGVVGQVRGAGAADDVSLGVVRDRGFTQPDGRRVGLGGAHDVGEQPRRLVDSDHEHAGGHGIQRSGMAHFPGTGDPPHPANHIVAGPSLRLVHYYQSRKHASQYIGASRAAGSAASAHLPPKRHSSRGRKARRD